MELILHGDFNVSGDLVLTTIPRKSNVFATDADIGSSSIININRASDAFRHTVEYSFKGLTGIIAEKTSQTNLGWTVPTSFFQKIPESQNGTVTITCKTYSGDTLIGTSSTTATVNVPTSGSNNSMPVVESATVVDTNSKTIDLTDSSSRLVNYFSKVKLSVTGKCLNYAGFKTLREHQQIVIPATTSVSGGTTTVKGEKVFEGEAKTDYRVTLVDTRNIPSDTKVLNEANGDFIIVPYIPLTMKANVERKSQTSNSIKMNFTGNFYNGYYDEAKSNFNNLKIKWRYKLTDSGTWIANGSDNDGWHNLTLNTDFKYDEGKNTYQSKGDITISDLFDYQEKYTIEISYEDELSSYSVQKPLPAGIPNHDYGVDDEGKNYFNVNGNYFRNGKNLIDVIKQYILEGNEYSLNDLCSMFNNYSMEFYQNTAWAKVKVPFTNSTVRGERLKFNSSNSSIVCNEDGIVDIEGMFNFYCNNSYITNTDYGLYLYKNGDYYASLSYEYATSAAFYQAIGFYYPNIPVKKGDYFQLYVSTGGTGKIKTFAGFNTCVTAKYIKGV